MKARAKRLGWDEQLSPEQEFDHDPYEYPSDNLEGELQRVDVPGTLEHSAIRMTLVDGQEADPHTVVEL